MTRYEKLKPGMVFLLGEEGIETIEKAASSASDYLDCWNCPCYQSCMDTGIIGRHSTVTEDCEQNLLVYLSEELNERT